MQTLIFKIRFWVLKKMPTLNISRATNCHISAFRMHSAFFCVNSEMFIGVFETFGSSATKPRTKKRLSYFFPLNNKIRMFIISISWIYIQSTWAHFCCCFFSLHIICIVVGLCIRFSFCFIFRCNQAHSCAAIIEWTNLKRLSVNFNPNSRVSFIFFCLHSAMIVSTVNYNCHIVLIHCQAQS